MSTAQSSLPTPCAWELFRSVLSPDWLNALQPPAPQCAYTPWVVTWLLVYQRLRGGVSLNEAVGHFLFSFPPSAWPDCRRLRQGTLSANSGAYSQARTELSQCVLEVSSQSVFTSLIDTYPPSWRDRRVFILDGTTVSLPATAELKRVYTPASNQYGPSHWPLMHLVVAHELSSGLAATPRYGAMYGPDAVSEVALAVGMLADLPGGSILLADRNFGVFAFVYPAVASGRDVVVRLTQARYRVLAKKAKPIEPGRKSLRWKPSAYERKARPDLPADATVGGWLYEVHVRKDLTLWLFSTVEGTGEEMAELYRQRGDIETNIRDLKSTLRLDRMSGQSQSMVVKELHAALVAYNLTTQVRRLAATRAGVAARQLSFAGVKSLVEAFACVVCLNPTQAQCQQRFEQLLRAAGQRRLPKRRAGRSYPREVIPRGRKFPERKRVKPTAS
jgi:hypothetical protein